MILSYFLVACILCLIYNYLITCLSEVFCDEPDISEHTTLLMTERSEGDVITFNCEYGFEMHDGSISMTSQCGADGNWSISPFPCERKKHMSIITNNKELTYIAYI